MHLISINEYGSHIAVSVWSESTNTRISNIRLGSNFHLYRS